MHAPYLISFEIINHCNFNCAFCFGKNLKSRVKETMPFSLFEKMVEDLKTWFRADKKIRFDFNGGVGEAYLVPELDKYISLISNAFPKSYLTIHTNGSLLTKEKIESFFDNGGKQLIIDCYFKKTEDRIAKLIEANSKYEILINNVKENTLIDLVGTKRKIAIYAHKGKKKYLILSKCYDMATSSDKRAIKKLHNGAGSVTKGLSMVDYTPKINKSCHEPFRNMVIRSNGVVPLCCAMAGVNDIVCGKFPEQKIKDIWEGEIFTLCRNILKTERTFFPCNICSHYPGIRMGFEKLDNINLTKKEIIKKINESQIQYKKYKDNLYFDKLKKNEKKKGLEKWI